MSCIHENTLPSYFELLEDGLPEAFYVAVNNRSPRFEEALESYIREAQVASYDTMFNPFSITGTYPTTFESIRMALGAISRTGYKDGGGHNAYSGEYVLSLWDSMTPEERKERMKLFTIFILRYKADLLSDCIGDDVDWDTIESFADWPEFSLASERWQEILKPARDN